MRLYSHQLIAFANYTQIVASITQYSRMDMLAEAILQRTPHQFVVVGLSMGGIVAMEMLRQQPQRICGLCLMDTNPLAEATHVQQKRVEQIQKVQNGELEQVMRNEMKPLYLAQHTYRVDILDLCMHMATNLGAEVFVRQSYALQNRIDQQQTLASYTKPSLILHGEHDMLCPVDRHVRMHELMPHANYASIAQAGHLPTLEQPDQVTMHMRTWLDLI